jgi:hypothetical protein
MDRALEIVTSVLNGTYEPTTGDHDVLFLSRTTTRIVPEILEENPELIEKAKELVQKEFEGEIDAEKEYMMGLMLLLNETISY